LAGKFIAYLGNWTGRNKTCTYYPDG